MVDPEVDAVVVGAGVLGLAVARALAMAGRDVIVIEQASTFGQHVSSRSSEVIHAGFYYPPGSLKARTCVRGRALLYDFCRRHGVPHRRIGKLVVATAPAQDTQLEALLHRGLENGVDDLELRDAAWVARREPELRTHGALWSPSTGIVDSHGFMHALLAEGMAHGLQVAWRTRVASIEPRAGGLVLQTSDASVTCRMLVNAAGLEAVALAHRVRGVDLATLPKAFFAKGRYFALQGRVPFQHLVYPLPEGGGLGIHLTLDLHGRARFGPDHLWTDEIEYTVEDSARALFETAIQRYWPNLPRGRLQPDYAGIRPKIFGPHDPPSDFLWWGPRAHGIPGLHHLLGFESPGLTAALAIAEHIAADSIGGASSAVAITSAR